MLLVRHAGRDDGWGVLGGAVDVGELPAAAAVREAREEISADVQLVRLVTLSDEVGIGAALGGSRPTKESPR